MKGPKCRLCGKEHYGQCNVTEHESSNVTSDVILQKDQRIEELEAHVKFLEGKMSEIRAEGCQVCKARREANKQRVRAHRERQKA